MFGLRINKLSKEIGSVNELQPTAKNINNLGMDIDLVK